MTAPTYHRAPHRHVWQTHPLRWEWEVTDGIGGQVLAEGHAWTRAGADVDSILAELDCKPSLQLRLERAADRLTREGLPVRVRLDERDRVCVTPLCVCSTRDSVRISAAFLAITANVRMVP